MTLKLKSGIENLFPMEIKQKNLHNLSISDGKVTNFVNS